jgi:hypothetical protein
MSLLPRAAAAFVLAVSAVARADDEPDPRCTGTHSLASPLPDACLGYIDTDRPHQTDTPHVVPAGHFQFESALGSVQLGGLVDAPTGDRTAHVVLFDDNYKAGLVTGVDVQLLFAHAAFDPAEGGLLPPGPLAIRAKFNIVHERGWVPDITLVPWVFLPVAPSETFRAGPYVFWGWDLPANLELEMNAGVLFGVSPKSPAALVLASALTYAIVDHFSVFIDIYTTWPDTALGTGILWAFTRDMQLDAGTYIGLHGDLPRATLFLGFSFRR